MGSRPRRIEELAAKPGKQRQVALPTAEDRASKKIRKSDVKSGRMMGILGLYKRR